MTKDELIGLRRKLQLKGASSLNKAELIDLLLQHPKKINKILKPSNFDRYNQRKSIIGLIISTIFFLIMFSLFWYGRLNPISNPNIVDSDEIITNVSIIQDVTSGRLYSLTEFRHEEIPPVEFHNYKRSLRYIDRLPNNKSFNPEIDYTKYWDYTFSTKEKRDLLVYSFWRWMMQFSQAYILSSEIKNIGVNNSRSGTLIDDGNIDISQRRIIDESNELLTNHETTIFLPNNAIFEKTKNGYKIETEYSVITINFSQGSQREIRYSSNSLTKKIFEEYNLDKSKSQNEISFVIHIKYSHKNKDVDSKWANFEYRWFQNIKKNVVEDFEFDSVSEKILSH